MQYLPPMELVGLIILHCVLAFANTKAAVQYKGAQPLMPLLLNIVGIGCGINRYVFLAYYGYAVSVTYAVILLLVGLVTPMLSVRLERAVFGTVRNATFWLSMISLIVLPVIAVYLWSFIP